ncbi:MAG: galactokinase family protein [Vicinamibacterales bacterium]
MVPAVASIDAAGLRAAAAASKRALLARARAAIRATGPQPAAFFVPGRIEVLGKHTDYAGGRSLLCAAEQGFCLVAAARSDRLVTVVNADTGDRADLALTPDLQPVLGHWSNYPATVLRRVARNFPGARIGADLAFASDLPPASGMSSSSAFMVAVFLALATLNDLDQSAAYLESISRPTDLAGYLGTVENGRTFGALAGDTGVGTFGGSEDHTAILCCRASTLSQYRFAPVHFERDVPMPGRHVFAVAFSGVLAEKTGAALATYNRASWAASRVLQIWRDASGTPAPTLEAAATERHGAVDRIREAIAASGDTEFGADLLRKRFDQFVLESQAIVPGAGDSLRDGDLARFGALVDRSQEAAEAWLGNQVPETSCLAREARRLGAAAASAFGAGFGGSVWALIAESACGGFLRDWRHAYERAHPEAAARAVFFETSPGPAALRLA